MKAAARENQKQQNSLKIRPARENELSFFFENARLEGWNPGLNDVQVFASTDPSGFLLGIHDEDDQVVACISSFIYNDSFAFIGYYIVLQKYRARGYGLALFQAALTRLGPTRNIALDGVVEQQRNYEKSGFSAAHDDVRYVGSGTGPMSGDNPPTTGGKPPFQTLVLDEVRVDKLIAYDTSKREHSRHRLLRAWFTQPAMEGFTCQNSKGEIIGYGCIRPAVSMQRIGPLVADTVEIAECLFSSLRLRVNVVEKFCIDVPGYNSAATGMVKGTGAVESFVCARMYTKGMPRRLDTVSQFGQLSFEVG